MPHNRVKDLIGFLTDEVRLSHVSSSQRHDKVAKHIFTTSLAIKLHSVDTAGIGRRNRLVLGEIVPETGSRFKFPPLT